MKDQEQIQQQSQQQNERRGRKSATLLLLLILLVTITVGFAVLSASLNIHGTSTLVGGWCVGPNCDNTCKDAEDPNCGIIECPASENCEIIDCTEHPTHCTCENGVCEPTPINCTTNPEKCTKPNCTVTATETCECQAGDTGCIPNPQIWMDGDTVYFRHTLQKPGDVFTFNTTYKNTGSIDAKITNVTKSELNATAQRFMTYDVTYTNNTAPAPNDTLAAGGSATYKVTVAYKSTVTTLPTTAELALINENADGHTGATSLFTVNYEQK